MPRRKCPTNKVALRDEISAKLVILARQNTGHKREKTEKRAYRCVCGWWHTTSQEKKEKGEQK